MGRPFLGLQSVEPNMCPARSPGPLGLNDAADPNQSSVLGPTPGPTGVNDAAAAQVSQPQSASSEKPGPYQAIIDIIDADPTLEGSGITIIDDNGNRVEVRGGPRQKWVYISSKPIDIPVQPQEEKKLPGFWDVWGDSVLNCGSATATGVVIYLSGGTASFVVGAFAVNSAALCGMSIGKAIEYDEWQAFEKEGGGAYTAWLTLETAMSLADLFNGVKGAMGFIKGLEEAGKLDKLAKAVNRQKLTRKQLAKLITEIDSKAVSKIAGNKAGYISKAKLIKAGKDVIKANNFKTLAGQQARVVIDAIGNALTLGGTSGTFNNTQKTAEIYFIQYDEE